MRLLFFSLVLLVGVTFCFAGQDEPLGSFQIGTISDTTSELSGTVPPYRQAGDTMESATIISGLPFFDTGTTAGFQNDYESSCPYTSPAPDVVYSFSPSYDQYISIDLCGSQYNTQLFVWDSDINEIACSSDFYPYFTPCEEDLSRIDNCEVFAGNTYFIFVDGYVNASGYYEIFISEDGVCQLGCPENYAEGEPALYDGYVDQYNNGCSGGNEYFQGFPAGSGGEGAICGVSGWYYSNGYHYRDKDYYSVVAGPTGVIDLALKAEYAMDVTVREQCGQWEFIEGAHTQPCEDLVLSVNVNPGQEYWIYLTPVRYRQPFSLMTNEFTYNLQISGVQPGTVATKKMSFDALKAAYRKVCKK